MAAVSPEFSETGSGLSAPLDQEFEELAAELGRRIVDSGLRGLVLRFGDETRIVGVADRMPPAATLEAPFDELHAVLRRSRTADELRALRWIGNPEPYIGLLGPE